MGLFSKVFRAVFGQSDGGKTQGGTDFEKQVRKDGVAHAGKRIAEELTERMEILTARTGTKVKELAKQFVLEELDAARHGDEFAQNFARESGYKPSEYIGAMGETKWKGEESELEHLQLFVRVFTSKISDPTFRAKLSIAVVDEFMKHWKLGKYSVQKTTKPAAKPEKKEATDKTKNENRPIPSQEIAPASEIKIHTNSIGIKFALIPAGTFRRDAGNMDNPMHNGLKVTISKPFYLGIYPVIQEEWQAVMGDNPSRFKGENCPVDSVSWDDAQEFIKRLNVKEGHHRYRLPSKMEWELAAKGGMETRWFFGDSEKFLNSYAWFRVIYERTMPVGDKKPNPYGLYDIYGNVSEWVQDWRHRELPNGELQDYSGPSSGEHRALCGGCWLSSAESCLESFSLGAPSNYRQDGYGFRLALSTEGNAKMLKAPKQKVVSENNQGLIEKAEAGDIEAQYNLGMMYCSGKEVPQDYVKAAQWFLKAAEQNDAKAQFNLGGMYDSGDGVPQDYVKAMYWFKKAAKQNEAKALYNIGVMYENGKGVDKDNAKAAHWIKKSAEQGDALAQWSLGDRYDCGNGVPQNYGKAVDWYRKSAEQGYATAQYNLGISYHLGEGVEQDNDKAAQWFQKAAKQGDAKAQYNLGVMYYQGIGVIRNIRKACSLLRASAGQGHRDAIAGYSRFCEGIEDSEFEDENYEDNDFDDSDNELRLIDVVKKISNLHEGIFANINNDLGEYFTQGNVSRSSPIVLMAYAYARRTAAAGLFVQGVFDRGTYKIASSTFTAMQLHTGHTVEFQEEAARQAEELLGSYDSRLDKLTIGLITTMVEQYKTPERYDGKNHTPYEVVITALQYTINENNPCPLSGQIFPKQ